MATHGAPFFDRLSALDAAMVFLETDEVLMHVGMLAVFEEGPLRLPSGELDLARMRTHAAGVLDELPRHRQRLAFTPIEGHPVWVDDPYFDADRHLFFHPLPPGTDDAALRVVAGRILGERLARDRSPWELHFLTGLSDGRFAVIAKLHHCMADGMAALRVFGAFFSSDPTTADRTPGPHTPRPAPSPRALLRAEGERRIGALGALVSAVLRARAVPSRDRAPRGGGRGLRLSGLVEALRSKTTLAMPTPLNPGALGRRRAYGHTVVPLETMKQIKLRLGGTVNDAVLAAVAGAVRRYFELHGVPAGAAEIHVVMPFDARAVVGDAEGQGNRVVPTLVRLPIELDSPAARFHAIAGSTHRLKTSGQVEGVAFLEDLANLAVVKPLTALVRAATRFWAGHFIVTNLPGPKQPAYFLGARMLACYPVVPLMANQALGVALLSYAGNLHFGVLADPDAVHDLDVFVACIDRELAALRDAT